MTTQLLRKPKSPVMVMRREHKELLDELAPKKTQTRVRCCAAHLISYFTHWHEWKREHYPTEWIYQPLTEIRHDHMDSYTIHVIRDAIELLKGLGFLETRKNNRVQNWRNGQDKTYQYLLRSDRIEEALEKHYRQSEAQTLENSPFVTVDTSRVNVEIPCVISDTRNFADDTHTQIPSLIPTTDSCFLSEERERIDFVQELEDLWELPGNDVRQELMNSCNNLQEKISQEENSGLDKNSAASALKCDELVQNDVKPLPKLKSDRVSGFHSQEERDDFYQVLLELGKSQGKRSPVAWAGAIIKSIDAGDPCQYLSEYRAGQQVGGCEKQEWEIAPGQPFPRFVSYLKARLKKTGMTDEEAIASVHRQLNDVSAARSLWESCKRSIVRYAEDWKEQRRLGVENAYLPPELLPHREVSPADLTTAIESLQAGCVQLQALPSSSAPAELELAKELPSEPAIAEQLEPVADVVADVQGQVSPTSVAGAEPERPSLASLQKALNMPIGASLTRISISQNPQWGYRVEEDIVLPANEMPSLELLQSLLDSPSTAPRVRRLIARNPDWGFFIDAEGRVCDW